MTTYAQQIAERDRQIAEAVREAAAKLAEEIGMRDRYMGCSIRGTHPVDSEINKNVAEIAAQIRSLDLDAIIASVPKEQPEADQDERERFEAWASSDASGWDLASKQRLPNGEYRHPGFESDWKVWQAAKRDALTQARELTDAEILEIAAAAELPYTIGTPEDGEMYATWPDYVVAFSRLLLSASKGEK